MTVALTGDSLTIAELVDVAREKRNVDIDDDALAAVRRARTDLEERIDAADRTGEPIYGVNTGFGALADEPVSADERSQHQTNLIRSHAVGVGEPLSEAEVRGTMASRLNSLLSGRSGVREDVVKLLEGMLNRGVYPHVPRKGSASASGDLAPLAHLVLVMMGEGKASVDGQWVSGSKALQEAELDPITLREKEGLALINGTNFVTAIGALAVHDARVLVDSADAIGGMSLEAQRGISDAFRREIHELRGQPGQKTSAENIRQMYGHENDESDLVRSSEESGDVQDEYSLRCMPQVHGASRDVVEFAEDVIRRELNAVTDNPLVLDDAVVSGGNFHGQPVAMALDALTTAVAELADISERRLFSLIGGDESRSIEEFVNAELKKIRAGEKSADEALEPLRSGYEAVASGDATVEEATEKFEAYAYEDGRLPAFLIAGDEPGLHSGFIVTQVTAAALVSENKTLVHPSSSDSVPTADGQEDHVSMGANAANHLTDVIDNTTRVLAIEAFAVFQALEMRDGSPGETTQNKLELLDEHEDVGFVDQDRVMTGDIDSVRDLIASGKLTP